MVLKKLISLITVAMMLLTPLSCLAQQQSATFTMAGFDGDDSSHDWSTNKFFTLMEQKTGVSFTFNEKTNYSQWRQEKDRMFSTDDLPDVFFKAELSSEELIRYTDSGQLIDLKPLLEQNAPNLWKLLTKNPDWLAAITLPSGKIGALPKINPTKTQNAMWINKEWLDTLGLDMPTDAQSLYTVLKAFKTGDPNKNGKQDEIPLTFLGAWDLKFLGHAFGLIANDYNVFVDEQGKVQYMPLQEQFLPFVQYLCKLYSEGLLLKNGFYTADTLRVITDKDAAVTYGVMLAPTPMTYMYYGNIGQYAMLTPLEYGGKRVYRDLVGNLTRGTFAITKNCADPARMLRWVDLLYTEEGGRLALAGEENVDYAINEDGTWKYLGEENMLAYTIDDVILYNTGNMPWLFPTEFEGQYAMQDVKTFSDQARLLSQYVIEPFPTSYTLTARQRETILPIQQTLGNKVDLWISRCVMGELEPTMEAYEVFKQELNADQLAAFLDFWQNVYDFLSK